MTRRILLAVGRFVALVLFATVAFLSIPFLMLAVLLMLLLGLAAVAGMFWGCLALAVGDYQQGVMALALGASAFVAITLVWDRVFAMRDMTRRRPAPDAIAASNLRIDFNR